MSTATVEPTQTEALVQQPERAVLFLSHRSDLRLVHTGRYPIMVPSTGQRIGETSGVTVAFHNHEFRCPESGEVKIMDPGGAGEATMDAADLLSWLQTHRRFGDPNEGFVRVDPKAPPIGQEEQERLMKAATEWDVDTLQSIAEQERAGWQREQVIRSAEGAIERILEAEERVRTQLEAEAAQAEPKAKGK